MAGKIFARTYNCYYCKTNITEASKHEVILNKKTKLYVCKKCKEDYNKRIANGSGTSTSS